MYTSLGSRAERTVHSRYQSAVWRTRMVYLCVLCDIPFRLVVSAGSLCTHLSVPGPNGPLILVVYVTITCLRYLCQHVQHDITRRNVDTTRPKGPPIRYERGSESESEKIPFMFVVFSLFFSFASVFARCERSIRIHSHLRFIMRLRFFFMN